MTYIKSSGESGINGTEWRISSTTNNWESYSDDPTNEHYHEWVDSGLPADGPPVIVMSEEDYLAITPETDRFYSVSCQIHVTSVSLNYTADTIGVGNTLQLVATISPLNADDPSVTWSSSDETKATVDEDGLVTAIADGSATITCMSTDGDKTATFVANIITNPQLWYDTVSANGLTVTIEKDGNKDVFITINGTTTTSKSGYYSSNITSCWDITGVSPWCILYTGDALSASVTWISGTGPTSANVGFGLQDTSGNVVLAGATWTQCGGNGGTVTDPVTFTTTLTGNKTIRGFRGYFTSGQSYSNLKFKVTFSVNGESNVWF